MEWLDSLLTGTRLIDVVIAATLIEWAVLLLLWRQREQGVPPRLLGSMLLPGLCLMLAARSAITGAPWYWLALLLTLAGLVHLLDLKSRWKK